LHGDEAVHQPHQNSHDDKRDNNLDQRHAKFSFRPRAAGGAANHSTGAGITTVHFARPDAAQRFSLVSATAPTNKREAIVMGFLTRAEGLRETHFRWAELSSDHE